MNEILLALRVLIDLTFVFLAYRLGKAWLVIAICVNLILISTLGGKITPIFGFLTNVGNVFYAAVFFAIQLVTERYGREEALRRMWMGFGALVFYLIMSELTIQYAGSADTATLNQNLNLLFRTVPRIALAALVAYLIAQHVNIYLYDYLHRRDGRRWLGYRAAIACIVGQLVDSMVFFSIAFMQVLPYNTLLQTMMVGYALKVVIGFISIPFLYVSRRFNQEKQQI